MRHRPAELNALFRKFKNGDPEALDALLSSEGDRLFDYLMRMTGQVSRSFETVRESGNAVTPVADQESNLQGLLVLLYKTARNFTIEIWNAETSRLENASYFSAEADLSEKAKNNLLELEKVVRSLPAKQREVLLLHLRYGFALDEVAAITGYDLSDVEEFLEHGKNVSEAVLSASAGKFPDLMVKMLVFPTPIDESEGTQNLSLVVRDLKKSSRGSPSGFLRLVWGAVFVSMVIYAVWNHELVFFYLRRIFDR